MRLWRPVGSRELDKIRASDMRAFPPRLTDQPIFYPVLTFDYAERIAGGRNSVRKDHGFAGFVVTFEVDDAYVSRFPVQTAGGQDCKELWVAADELDTFNRNILGPIEIAAEYRNGVRILAWA